MIPWNDVIATVGTALGGFGGWFLWRESHADRRSQRLQAQIDLSVGPVSSRITGLEQKFADSMNQNQQMLEVVVTRSLSPVSEKMGDISTRIAVLENTQGFLRDLMHGQAQVLHQPDPRRHHIDILLEALMEDRLTADEETELRGYLHLIKEWEPGKDVGFPVHPGEPTSASILLATMDHVLPPREKHR
jgi:hypothetical protein